MELLNSNVISTIIGAIVGGIIAIIASDIAYRRQRKDAEKREMVENFKHKAELNASDGLTIPIEKIQNAQVVNAVFCSYEASLDDNQNVTVEYPKALRNTKTLAAHTIFFENIGDSDINELEISVENPKNCALVKKDCIDEYIKEGFISYGILLDRKIRRGDVVSLTIYYYEKDPVISQFGASLVLFYRDSLNNICEQPVFPEQNKTYEPSLISQKEWREHVNVTKNLSYWEDRLITKKKGKNEK